MGREHQNLRVWKGRADLPAGLDTGAPREADVHDHDVGWIRSDRLQSGVGIACLGDDPNSANAFENAAEFAADQLVVITQQHPDHRVIGHACTLSAESEEARTIGFEKRDLLLWLRWRVEGEDQGQNP